MTFAYPETAEPGERPEAQKNSLIDERTATSRALARAQIKWTPEERKLFVMCLTKIRWTQPNNNNVVELKKKEVAEALGLKYDSTDLSQALRKMFQKLARDSEVHWTDPRDRTRWADDFLIGGRTSTRETIKVEFNQKFMPHLEDLVRQHDYLTMWSSDIYSFKSSFTFALYDELRLHYDSRRVTNYRTYSTDELRKIFGLSKDAYMRKDGKLARTGFERYTLDVAIEEINQSKTMSILPIGSPKNGKMQFYEKKKRGGMVTGYTFKYTVKTRVIEADPEEIDGQMTIFDYMPESEGGENT